MAIDLEEIVDALSMLNDETNYYYDTKEERVEVVFDFDGGDYDDDDEEVDWEDERYISLPSSYDVDDYEIMTDFMLQINDPQQQRRVEDSLRGHGAFRRFRATLDELDLTQQWYDFRDAAYREKAIEWCNDNDVSFVENAE